MPDPPCPPPPSARETITQTFSWINPTVPPVVPEEGCILSLPDLVDLGLQNSPTTRAAWYQAKEAATDVGSARGAYLPRYCQKLCPELISPSSKIDFKLPVSPLHHP